jgi:hypothetical protein
MNQYLDKFEEIVDKEIVAYSELESMLVQKTELIHKNEVDKLEELDIKIIEHTTSLTNLIRARQNQCIYIERIDLTFSEVIERIKTINEAQAERLQQKKQIMEKLTKEINKQNNINAKLIQNTLLIMNRTVDFILKLLAPELDLYNQRGQMSRINDNYKICSIEQEA